MATLLDLNPTLPRILLDERPATYPWEDLAYLWDRNDMGGVHDWLNARWSRLVETRLLGQRDPEAEFLQALAFAALALHFTQNRNQEGALLMLDDALLALGRYRPGLFGVRVEPIIDTLNELRPMIVALAPDDDCPMQPFVYRRFELRRTS
jgi:uncharacterized protein